MSGPSFRNPPAIERVLSVQFRELAGFELVHFGMWFERIRAEFPLSTRQGRLPPIIEHFPALSHQRHVRFDVGVPLGRCVYSTSEPSTRLQQLQPDRFAMNWRRTEGDAYLKFSETSRRFNDSFAMFTQFCSEAGLPTPVVDLCEVTYVNRMACPRDVDPADHFAQVFGHGLLGERTTGFPAPSALEFNRRFDFPDDKGRLYAEATSAGDGDERFHSLKMVGRTVVRDGEDWRERLTLAHDWVVNGFVAITQEAVRKDVWEQTDV